MLILFVLISTVVLFIIQVGVWYSIPKKVRAFLCAVPLLGFLSNLAASSFILMFSGTGTFIGLSNLGASIFMAFVIIGYKHAKGIEGLQLGYIKLWVFNVVPKIMVVYRKEGIENGN